MSNNYGKFIKSKFREYETTIPKEILFVLPIFLNINLKIISLDEYDPKNLWSFDFSSKSESFNNESLNVPNLSNSTIYLFSWKDHYDLLLPEGVKSFMDFKKFGTKNLKPFGILFENKNVNSQLSYSEGLYPNERIIYEDSNQKNQEIIKKLNNSQTVKIYEVNTSENINQRMKDQKEELKIQSTNSENEQNVEKKVEEIKFKEVTSMKPSKLIEHYFNEENFSKESEIDYSKQA